MTRTQGAGLRQRREGLTDRLTWRRGGVLVSKRVPPGVQGMTALQQWIDRRAACDPCMALRVFAVAHGCWLPWFDRLG